LPFFHKILHIFALTFNPFYIKHIMKLNFIPSLIITMAALSFSSCVWVYRTNTVFMPSFEQKDDLHAEASIGSGEFSFNAGYAFAGHWAGTASLQQRGEGLNNYHELGLVYFTKVSEKTTGEFLGAFGKGSFRSRDIYNSWFSQNTHEQLISAEFYRSSLQYNLNYNYYDLTFSAGTRLSYVHFKKFDDLTRDLHNKNVIFHIHEKNFSQVYLEPVVALSYNTRYITIFGQTGGLFLIKGNLDNFIYNPFVLNVGVRVRFNLRNNNRID
jgi:hypothetical protein